MSQAGVEHVLIGLSDLQYVAQNYALDGVLTLVDAKHIGQHLDERKPEGVVNEALSQVAYADRIILNKTDLVRRPNISTSPDGCSAKNSVWASSASIDRLVMLTEPEFHCTTADGHARQSLPCIKEMSTASCARPCE